jgi:hypothetical protein
MEPIKYFLLNKYIEDKTMKNFQIRIWHGKDKEMIYPSESFYWHVSLDGEVFKGKGVSIKDSDDCHIMLYSGLMDVAGIEIYEGTEQLTSNLNNLIQS